MTPVENGNITQIRFQPTLFVYLGTSSGQIGYRLKKLLRQAYGDVPVLRHLWIDIDTAVDPQAQPFFADTERVELSGLDPANVISHLDNHPTIKEWWPDAARLSAGMLAGGGSPQQMRLVGRLALFRMFNDRQRGASFIARLRQATEAMFQIENITAVEAKSTDTVKYTVEPGCRVIIVHSTGGGTGSSMAFDIAYLCRSLLQGRSPRVIDFTFLPAVIDLAILGGAVGQREKVRANTYAWFKEDNYLTENPEWNVQYPEGAPVQVAAPPFDYRFIVDLANQGGYRLSSPEDVYNMIAQAIFLDTGSSISGAMRGFTANVAALGERFKGRRCSFSSLAAASLIFPKERLLEYCSSRLAAALLTDGVLAQPDASAVSVSASSLLQRLGLRDIDLLPSLMENAVVNMHLEAPISKADSVAAAISYVDTQEAENEAARKAAAAKVEKNRDARLAALTAGLEQAVVQLAAARGAAFALAVCAKLLEAAPAGAVDAGAVSLPAMKARVLQQGAGESDLQIAKAAYKTKRDGLRRLDDGPEDKLEMTFNPKGWKKKFVLYKNDVLAAMRSENDLSVQLAAVNQASGLYDQLIETVTAIQARLTGVSGEVSLAAAELKAAAERMLHATAAQTNVYEFLHEIDLDFEEYYQTHTNQANPAALFPEIFAGQTFATVEALGKWVKDQLKPAALMVARHVYQPDLEKASLLTALEAIAARKGKTTQALLEEELDKLIKYCLPFWEYDHDLGLPDTEGKSIIGVEDERSPLIPRKYREGAKFEIHSTCVADRVDILHIEHGLPAFMIRGMADFKAVYERKRKGIDPLHILPGMDSAPDVFPEEGEVGREMFAIGLAFGYIVQVGSYYYYDPERAYLLHKIQPGKQFRLANGREKAEDAFLRKTEWVEQVDDSVEADVRNMGNEAAIRKLDEAIASHQAAIAAMPTSDDSLRKQFEKEIKAFRSMQRRLGKIG